MRDRTTMALLLIVCLLAALAWERGGPDLALDGLLTGGKTLLSATPLLLAAFLIAGLVQVLVTKEVVTRWLGAGSGWRGLLLAYLGGALMPGGPYVYYPITAALLKAGAGLGVLVTFVCAKNIWSLSRMPLEFALLGARLTLIRLAVTAILPLVLGLLSEWLFGRWIERIREGAPT